MSRPGLCPNCGVPLEGEEVRTVAQETRSENGGLPAQELVISDEELVEEITRRSDAYLGLSYEGFVGAYRAGTLPDTGPVNELVILQRFVEDSPGFQNLPDGVRHG